MVVIIKIASPFHRSEGKLSVGTLHLTPSPPLGAVTVGFIFIELPADDITEAAKAFNLHIQCGRLTQPLFLGKESVHQVD